MSADVFFSAEVVICQSPVMDAAVQYVAVYDDEEQVANRSKLEPWLKGDTVWTGKNYRHLCKNFGHIVYSDPKPLQYKMQNLNFTIN